MERIYLDHAATTPLSPAAREAMQPWLDEGFGNPSSLYQEGRRAREAVDQARETLSARLGCDFAEVIFTSSGTEAANLAIVGSALAQRDPKRRRILAGAAEHHAVLRCAGLAEAFGFQFETVAVDRYARLDLDDLERRMGDDVHLVALMHANNELGTIQPVAEAASLAHRHGALFFCDAVQTFAAMDWAVIDLDADLVSVAAHKVYGPKGVGALYVRAGTRLQPVSRGGGQERELRAGTENVAGIVGFAAAAQEAALDREGRRRKRQARDAFLKALRLDPSIDWTDWNHPSEPALSVPHDVPQLDGHAHLRFPGLSAESMLIVLDQLGVSASSGAACSSGSLEPSHVLLAAGYSEAEAKQGLRFTFGHGSTEAEADEAARRLVQAARQVGG